MWIAAWLQFDKRCQGEQQISARRTEKSDMGMMFGRIVRRKSHWSRWLTQNVCGIASVVTPQKMCFINKYTSWWICKTSIPCRKNMEKLFQSHGASGDGDRIQPLSLVFSVGIDLTWTCFRVKIPGEFACDNCPKYPPRSHCQATTYPSLNIHCPLLRLRMTRPQKNTYRTYNTFHLRKYFGCRQRACASWICLNNCWWFWNPANQLRER